MKQHTFNMVVKGLWKQQAFSIDEYGECQYRDEKGNRCGIGQLIPSTRYCTRLESKGADHIWVRKALPKCHQIDPNFLAALQGDLHDNLADYEKSKNGFRRVAFRKAVKDFAKRHDLTQPELT